MTAPDSLLAEAETHAVEGWDFSWLGDRAVTQPPPWDFAQIVARHAQRAPDLLDLGTGGGGWLASLRSRPARAVAPEAWPPNVEVARRRLEPLGVEVMSVASAPDNRDQPPGFDSRVLPFDDASFSLVVSRHESYLAADVARILRPVGVFLTQQMGRDPNGYAQRSASRAWNLGPSTRRWRRSSSKKLDCAFSRPRRGARRRLSRTRERSPTGCARSRG